MWKVASISLCRMAGKGGCDKSRRMRYFFSTVTGLSIVILPVAYGGMGGIFSNEITGCGLLLFFVAIGLALLIQTIWKGGSAFRKVQISALDFWVLCFLIYLVVNILFIGKWKPDRYVFFEWGAVITGYLLLRRGILMRNMLLHACCISGLVQAVIVICQRLGVISSNNMQFDVTGSLGNPGQVGGYIAICWVITLGVLWHIIKEKRYMYAGLLLVSAIIQLYALYLADSRAAWVAAISGAAGMLCFCSSPFILYCRKYKTGLLFAVCFIVSLGGIMIYRYRPLSADARLLIWKVSADMIADAPLFGHGVDSFAREYMLYQADFFKENPDSSFLSVADNVVYPFNEFIRITVRYGTIGLLLMLLLFRSALSPDGEFPETYVFKAGLVALLLFSFFSYPTQIFPLLMFYAFLLGGISTRNIFSFCIPLWGWRLLMIPVIVLGALTIREGLFISRMANSLLALYQKGEDIKESDYERMKDNVGFNDYYMAWLIRQFDVEADANERVKDIQPFCEGYCVLGRYYMMRKDYSKAEYFFNEASYMIPTRIRPRYYLWELNVDKGDIQGAIKMAEDILVMPLKIENTFTLKVKRKMREFIVRQSIANPVE